MTTFKKYLTLCFVIMLLTHISQAQSLKVGVYYTQKALDHMNANDPDFDATINSQKGIVTNIIADINTNLQSSYSVEFIALSKLAYTEPGHRNGGEYATNKYSGGAQVIEELIYHEALASNYQSDDVATQTPIGFELSENELDKNFISLDLASWTDINIIIADEQAGDQIVLATNVPYSKYGADLTREEYDDPLYAFISAKEMVINEKALAIAIYSLLGDPEQITIEYDEKGNMDQVSLLGYWLQDKDVGILTTLSPNNTNIFQCNLNELELRSLNTVLLTEDVINATTQTKVNAREWIRLDPKTKSDGSTSATKLLIGSDSFILFTSGLYTEASESGCPTNLVFNRSSTKNQDINPIITAVEEESQVPGEFLVYPNPFTHQLNIRFTADGLSEANLHIYDMGGRLMDQQTYQLPGGQGVSKIQYDGSQLQTGMYIYQLQLGETLKAGRIVKK